MGVTPLEVALKKLLKRVIETRLLVDISTKQERKDIFDEHYKLYDLYLISTMKYVDSMKCEETIRIVKKNSRFM